MSRILLVPPGMFPEDFSLSNFLVGETQIVELAVESDICVGHLQVAEHLPHGSELYLIYEGTIWASGLWFVSNTLDTILDVVVATKVVKFIDGIEPVKILLDLVFGQIGEEEVLPMFFDETTLAQYRVIKQALHNSKKKEKAEKTNETTDLYAITAKFISDKKLTSIDRPTLRKHLGIGKIDKRKVLAKLDRYLVQYGLRTEFTTTDIEIKTIKVKQ